MVTYDNRVNHVLGDLLKKGVTDQKKNLFLKRIGEHLNIYMSIILKMGFFFSTCHQDQSQSCTV